MNTGSKINQITRIICIRAEETGGQNKNPKSCFCPFEPHEWGAQCSVTLSPWAHYTSFHNPLLRLWPMQPPLILWIAMYRNAHSNPCDPPLTLYRNVRTGSIQVNSAQCGIITVNQREVMVWRCIMDQFKIPTVWQRHKITTDSQMWRRRSNLGHSWMRINDLQWGSDVVILNRFEMFQQGSLS